MDKLLPFKDELDYIKNAEIRKFTEEALKTVPDYFFSVPASSTGKYHPAYSLGEGGLLRHTRAAVRIALELFRMEQYDWGEDAKDMVIASLILHDGWKHGVTQDTYVRADHPTVAFAAIKNNTELSSLLSQDEETVILNNIQTHMGQWNKDYKTQQEILPKPQTDMQKLVHLCDYLASRRCLTMEFDIPVTRDAK
jgi:hypothetical protein